MKLTNEQLAEIGQKAESLSEDMPFYTWESSRLLDTDMPALLDMIAELQAENELLETSFEESERNKNRYAENMRDYYAESQVWRLEHDHQKKQAEVYFEKYKRKASEVAELKRKLAELGSDKE